MDGFEEGTLSSVAARRDADTAGMVRPSDSPLEITTQLVENVAFFPSSISTPVRSRAQGVRGDNVPSVEQTRDSLFSKRQ